MSRRLLVVAVGTLSLIACATETGRDVETGTEGASELGAGVPVRVLHNQRTFQRASRSDALLTSLVRSNVSLSGVREARVEEIESADGSTHLVVQLLSDRLHKVTVTRLDVDQTDKVTRIDPTYTRSGEDQVHGTSAVTYRCPDPEVQFITVCPNDSAPEIGWANEAGDAAEARGLKTVRLIKSQATHDAWLDYMACPKLVGNFYDGHANSHEIVVYDGAVTARELAASAHFNHEVTNIWLACQAYVDPMLTAAQRTAESQKYAAGINDLVVGPSDRTAVCAMKAALAGKPMTRSFQDCYREYDIETDHWGFGGDGSDYFGQRP